MDKQLKIMFALILSVLLSCLLVSLAPRFGRSIGTSGGRQNVYHYSGIDSKLGSNIVTYTNHSGESVEIFYSSMLSNHLEVTTSEYEVTLCTQLKKSVQKASIESTDPETAILLKDILYADANGSYYLLYIISCAIFFVSFVIFLYSNTTDKRLRITARLTSAIMFVFAVLYSIRII